MTSLRTPAMGFPAMLVNSKLCRCKASMCIRRRGLKHKWKATARICDYRALQIECFKRNVAPRAIEADIFEISVCEPVVRRSVAGPILQHQQEESLSQHLVSRFGRDVDLCSAV